MKRFFRPRPIQAVALIGAGALAVMVLAENVNKKSMPPTISINAAKSATVKVKTEAAPAEHRKPLSFYTEGVKSRLFMAPGSGITKQVTPVITTPVLPPIKPGPPVVPAVVNPFGDYTYSGTVIMNGSYIALVENTKSRDGQYLKKGDTFLGGTVSQIDERMFTVNIGGRDQTLAKTDNFKLTPLDKDASATTAPAAPAAQPGQPGQPAAPNQPAPAIAPPAQGPQSGQNQNQGRGGRRNRNRQLNNNFDTGFTAPTRTPRNGQ